MSRRRRWSREGGQEVRGQTGGWCWSLGQSLECPEAAAWDRRRTGVECLLVNSDLRHTSHSVLSHTRPPAPMTRTPSAVARDNVNLKQTKIK